MKKVLLTSAAVLALFASAPVFANSNTVGQTADTTNTAKIGDLFKTEAPVASKTPATSKTPEASKTPAPQMDKAPKDGFVDTDKPLASIPDATGDITNYVHYDDNGKLNSVDLSGSKNLTPKGENTYTKYINHDNGVRGARTNGAEAYKHDQEFLASKGLPTDGEAAKPAAPTMSQSAKDAEKVANKMSEGKAPSKTLPNTAAIK